jgi:hypothetical protein
MVEHGHPGTVGADNLLRHVYIHREGKAHQDQVLPVTFLFWT